MNINGLQINYITYGNENGKNLVLLHGWGQNIEMMKLLGDHFQKDYKITIIDLPGFGASEKPTTIWTIFDYMECVRSLLDKVKIDKPILIGHSFGGKITLAFASKYECEKIILLASPYRKEIQKLSTKTKVLKGLKKVPGLNKFEEFAKKHVGSEDYRNADPLLRKILVEHVNLDLTEDVQKIKCPALFIWGDRDTEAPYERAYELEKLVKDSGVVILEGGTHYAYIEFLQRVVSIINVFIN